MNILQSKQFSRLGISLFLGVLLTCLGIFALAGPPDLARAAGPICTVNSGGGAGVDYTTIQAAINDAGCTTINVTTVGTHNESLTIARSLTLNGAGKTSTIIDAGGTSRVITVTGSIEVHINNLRVTGGNATNLPAGGNKGFGGGIFVTGGSILHGNNLQIDNNVGNTASTVGNGFGGGLAVNTGSTYLTGTTIASNTAKPGGTGSGSGGGIYANNATLSLANSQIMSNSANTNGSAGGRGGGLFASASAHLTLDGNTWQKNVAHNNPSGDVEGNGGAIAVEFPTGTTVLTITNDIFTGNTANASNTNLTGSDKASGGAIFLNTTSGGGVIATLNRITMTQNIAKAGNSNTGEGRGGAIFARHATLVVKRATIIDNKASNSSASDTGNGGGIYIREPQSGDYLEVENTIMADNSTFQIPGSGDGAQLHIDYDGGTSNTAIVSHATLAGNSLNNKQAVYYRGSSAGDLLLITNTIIASHTSGIDNVNATGKALARYMLFYNNSNNQAPGSTAFPDSTGWVAGDPDPKFVSPSADNYHLSSSSPAIDVGLNGLTLDIDGDVRPYDGNQDNTSIVDIGADEFTWSTVYVPIIIKDN